MGHDKSRSSVSVGTVDWNDPNLDALLQKVDSWRLENRSDQPLQEVQIHVNSGWTASSVVSKPAQLISMDEQTMVLVTRFPVPQGDHVRVDSQRADGMHTVWACRRTRGLPRRGSRERPVPEQVAYWLTAPTAAQLQIPNGSARATPCRSMPPCTSGLVRKWRRETGFLHPFGHLA
jgi:hypothetical protein